MKKLSVFLSLVLIVSLLAGCAGTPVVYYSDCTCPTGSHDPAPAVTEPTYEPAEGALKTGLAVVTTASSTNASADAEGGVEFDVTLAAVLVDDNGVIVDCALDSIGTTVAFDASGAITTDLSAEIQTKNEKGDAYGMVAWGGAVAEWYEQAEALCRYATGKTVEELKNGAVNESGYAADADLATSATIYLGGYVSAIEAAVNNAQHLGAQAGDELKLAALANIGNSNNYDAPDGGNAQLDVDVTALTMNGETITSCVIDSVQAKVPFDAEGWVSSDLSAPFQTKNQLGESYGMVAWGGAIAEWNEQAASFAAYITGKTAEEVAGIAVNESTYPTDADLTASVTIAIGGFQALIQKAAASGR